MFALKEPGGGELSEKLTQDEVLMQYVFTLLTHKKTYMTACQFLEDMLQARRNVLNLNSVRESNIPFPFHTLRPARSCRNADVIHVQTSATSPRRVNTDKDSCPL